MKTQDIETTVPKLRKGFDESLNLLVDQINKGEKILNKSYKKSIYFDELKFYYENWHKYNHDLIKILFNSFELLEEFNLRGSIVRTLLTNEGKLNAIREDLIQEINKLKYLVNRLELYNLEYSRTDVFNQLEKIFNNFHKIAIQLNNRHAKRSTLTIQDEYDVQDLLHCLLLTEFNDIRPEEYSPNYAGGSTRMDFLLAEENIVIEVKITNNLLTDKKIGEQLLVDIERYKNHPRCQVLICFIYDPRHLLKNPHGLINDLNFDEDEYHVRTVISPYLI